MVLLKKNDINWHNFCVVLGGSRGVKEINIIIPWRLRYKLNCFLIY
jgi:hypothetical protein